MKKRYIVILCLCVVGILVCVYLGVTRYHGATEENTDLESLRDSIKVFDTSDAETDPPETEPIATDEPVGETETPETHPIETSVETAVPETDDPGTAETDAPQTEAPETKAPETEKPQTPAEPTLDFTPLWNLNPDIHAWIEIKGTKVDYPVLQNPYNDKKYLTTAYDGSWYIGGALFTQSEFNSTDFNDPVTVIYGHTMRAGTLFGQLQTVYTNPATFQSHNDIIIYLPDEVRHYAVFAAVPFDRYNVLDTYDFSTEYWFDRFFDKVYKIRSFSACFNEELRPRFGDRVLILSTCLNEDSTRRFLVMAVCRDDIADPSDNVN